MERHHTKWSGIKFWQKVANQTQREIFPFTLEIILILCSM